MSSNLAGGIFFSTIYGLFFRFHFFGSVQKVSILIVGGVFAFRIIPVRREIESVFVLGIQ